MSKKDGTLLIKYREDEGEVDSRRLAGMLGAATTVMLLFVIVAFSLGMVGAALGVGIGGLVANFGQVDADQGGIIYPTIGDQAACADAPQLEASLEGEAVVNEYVEFYKDLPLPTGATWGNAENVRITILSDLDGEGGTQNVTAQELDLRLTALEAEDVVIGNASDNQKAVIQEFSPDNYSTSDEANDSYAPSGAGNFSDGASSTTPEFGIDANGGFSLVNGSAVAHQVAFDQISLPAIDLAVNILNSSHDYANDSGPINRSVAPSDRNCEDLANESSAESVESPGVAGSSGVGSSAGYPSDQ